MMLLAALLAGCAGARVPPLTDGGLHVRQITAEEGVFCKYIKNVDYVAKLGGMGKSYEEVHQAGENGIRNLIASIGGNAYVYTRLDADSFGGRIHYSGQAFKCPPNKIPGQ
jgi:hypothetical protein